MKAIFLSSSSTYLYLYLYLHRQSSGAADPFPCRNVAASTPRAGGGGGLRAAGVGVAAVAHGVPSLFLLWAPLAPALDAAWLSHCVGPAGRSRRERCT